MVNRFVYIVFILPVVLSIGFSSIVMAQILQEPERELHFWGTNYSKEVHLQEKPLEIIGLEKQYTSQSPIQVQVKIHDSSFNCGDLYLTIISKAEGSVVTQSGYFTQCFEKIDGLLPIDDQFSELITIPGDYELIVEMKGNNKNILTTSEKFTIK